MICSRWLIPMILVVFLAVSLLAHQVADDESRTSTPITVDMNYKFSNGRTWRGLDRQTKIMWVDGTEEGIMFLMREVYPNESAPDRAIVQAQADSLTIAGFHMSDVVQQIDHFYADSSNLRVPTVDAYKYAMKKMHGANQQELENYQASLRQTYNQ